MHQNDFDPEFYNNLTDIILGLSDYALIIGSTQSGNTLWIEQAIKNLEISL